MRRWIKILMSVPGTVWFNFRYLPFRQALHLPIWLANNVRVRRMYRGGININVEDISIGMIRVGYHEADGMDIYSVKTIIDIHKGAHLSFYGCAHIGHGASICVRPNATLSVGNEFAISGTTKIISADSIQIGENVQFSWNSMVMDSDAHTIVSSDGVVSRMTIPIIIGNNVWIAANVTILKGTIIGNNTVVGSNALLTRTYQSNSVLVGAPAREIKKIEGWKS